MRLDAGIRLGHYEILGPLGAGGMGEVYRAKDLKLDRKVAIKVLPKDLARHPEARERFEREAKAVAALSHPNILTIFEFGSEGETHFAVTELLEGANLADYLSRKGKLDTDEVLAIAEALTRGLSAAHERGIIHRDVKPANIFLTASGITKILDFGLARSNTVGVHNNVPDGTLPIATGTLDQAAAPPDSPAVRAAAEGIDQLTTPGVMLGTIGYMAPEQVRGQPATPASDIFSVGCVLYELLSGKSPFRSNTATDTIAAILKEEPAALPKPTNAAARTLEQITLKALQKNPESRYPSAVEMHEALEDLKRRTFEDSVSRPLYRQPVLWAGLAVLLVAVGALGWKTQQTRARERWAREEALPHLAELSESQAFQEAFELANEIKGVIPNDPVLADHWDQISGAISFVSDPPGAQVSYRPYAAVDSPWTVLGTTPIEPMRLPLGYYRWKVEKSGFDSVTSASSVYRADFLEFITSVGDATASDHAAELSFRLHESGMLPPDMIFLAAGRYTMPLTGMNPAAPVEFPDYLMGRFEVTNRDYKEFVDAGGYSDPSFWNRDFLKEGSTEPFEEAMATFIDKTGRPGPSTWELGSYPDGLADHPVSGISWFEADAYAEFKGMSLPTIYQWARAALPSVEISDSLAANMIAFSNFESSGTRPVGELQGISRSGALDMAGNVREWCFTASLDERYSLGGSWEDNSYQITNIVSLSPWDRSPANGVRLSKNFEPLPERLLAAYNRPLPDFTELANSVSPEAFKFILQQNGYPDSPLNDRMETETVEGDGTIFQQITLDTAYPGERLGLRIQIPANAAPPYQAVIVFGGLDVLFRKSFESAEPSGVNRNAQIFLKSGRAIVWPILAHTLDRNDGQGMVAISSGGQRTTQLFRQWSMDLGRTLDYLAQDKNFDNERVAFYGLSLGSIAGTIVLPGEPRVRTAILQAGGMALTSPDNPPVISQAVFVHNLQIPVLMVNGRNDFIFPYGTQQVPMFELLGTPPEDKRHLVLEGGHANLPRIELVREFTDWLDKYLGPVTPVVLPPHRASE